MTRQPPRAQSRPRFAAEESLQRAVAEYLALCVPAAPTAESDMNDSWLPPRAQDEAHEAITLAGGVVTTCRSLDDVVAFLETLGVPSRAEVWCDAIDPPVPSLRRSGHGSIAGANGRACSILVSMFFMRSSTC